MSKLYTVFCELSIDNKSMPLLLLIYNNNTFGRFQYAGCAYGTTAFVIIILKLTIKQVH